MIELKQELFTQCLNYVQMRIDAAQLAINSAQKAAYDDTKSSAGDKYETGRAMMQQETDRNIPQLNEANKLKFILNKINPLTLMNEAGPGSVVITDNGNFYMAVSAGALVVTNETYFAISEGSPIGLRLMGLKEGQNFTLNHRTYNIKRVF